MEIETKIANIRVDIQSENIKNTNTIKMTLSSTTPIQPSYYDQTHTEKLKWTFLKTSDKYSHASQFTKHLSP